MLLLLCTIFPALQALSISDGNDTNMDKIVYFFHKATESVNKVITELDNIKLLQYKSIYEDSN